MEKRIRFYCLRKILILWILIISLIKGNTYNSPTDLFYYVINLIVNLYLFQLEYN